MRHFRKLSFATISALTLAGCADQMPSSPLATPPAGDDLAASLLADPEINKNDTYLSASLTVENSSTMTLAYPLYDPTTGTMKTSMTYAAPPETQTVEAAYDHYDRVRVQVTRSADPRDPQAYVVNPVRTIKTVATAYTLYDAAGAVIPVQYPEASVTRSPLALLGSLVGDDITAGVLMEYEGQQPVGPRPQGAQAEKVEFPDAGTMRVSHAAGKDDQTHAAVPEQGNGTITRTYRHRADKWVLDEVAIESKSSEEGVSVTSRQTLRLSNVRWHENAAENARRRQRVVPSPQGRNAGSGESLEPAVIEPICVTSTGPRTAVQSCPEPVDPPPPLPPPPGPRILLQHGIFSSGKTWDRMDPWLSSYFYFERKLIPNLSSTAGLAAQANQLTDAILASGTGNYILVGHSQGGLISRSWRSGGRSWHGE